MTPQLIPLTTLLLIPLSVAALDLKEGKGLMDVRVTINPNGALLADDSEGATNCSHPSDLGFLRQAVAFEPVLRKALR